MRAVAALALVLCTACNHMQAQYVTTVSSGSTAVVTSNASAVSIQGGPLGVLLLGSMILAATMDPRLSDSSMNYAMFSDWSAPRTPPEMQPDRSISEQDCTKPVDFSAGNLRCR